MAPTPIMVLVGGKAPQERQYAVVRNFGIRLVGRLSRLFSGFSVGHASTVGEAVEFVAQRAELPVGDVEASFQRGLMLWLGAQV